MPTQPEIFRLNLEYYRKQAKALLKAAQAGDPASLQRLPADPKLHDAQLAIAREQGFASWPRFRIFISNSGLDFQKQVTAFLGAATSDRHRAEEMLAAHPEIAGAGYYVALVLGDTQRVEQALDANPALAVGKHGPENCEPLVYLCFSRFANGRSDRAVDFAKTATILLTRGADPNTSVLLPDHPNMPLSCLYAATGINNNAVLAEALLKGGATPNDGESLYHSTEHPDLACMKLLLRYHATIRCANALKHILDREDSEGVRILLEAGADPSELNHNKETALHWAIFRGRSEAIIQQLVDAGVNLDVKRNDGRTAYAMAVLYGQTNIAELLKARGASTDLPPLDTPGSERLLPDLTAAHRTDAVRELLTAGIPIHGRGEATGTALHWACWKGYPDLVELLLAHGASLTIEDLQFHGTPAGWMCHGLHNCPERHLGNYPAVARLLLAAGATIAPDDIPTGSPAVDAVFREFGLMA